MSAPVVLVRTSGNRSGDRFEVDGELSIGRDQTTITLDDDRVSRRHALVTASADGLTIEDCGSANGTVLNGKRLDPGVATALRPGDEIRVGRTTFVVEGGAQPTVLASSDVTVLEATRAMPAPAAPPQPAPEPAQPPAGPPPAPPTVPLAAPPLALAPAAAALERPVPTAPFTADVGSAGRGIATRDIRVEVLTIGAILATAVGLILYFALR